MLAEDAIKSAISNYYTKNPSARTTDLGGTGASMPKIDVETVMTSGGQTATVWTEVSELGFLFWVYEFEDAKLCTKVLKK